MPQHGRGLRRPTAGRIMQNEAGQQPQRRPAALDGVHDDPAGRQARTGKQWEKGDSAKPSSSPLFSRRA